MGRSDRRRASAHARSPAAARARNASHTHQPKRPRENDSSSPQDRVLHLQRSAGNAAVSGLLTDLREGTASVQRKSVLDWAKELVGGEPTAAEVTLEEMDSELGTVIDYLEKAKTVADVVGQDKFTEGLGGVIDGLSKVKGPIGKVLKAQKTAREIRKFYNALQKLRTLDLNRDYEAGADAMSDLAEAAGELGGKLLPAEAGAVGAYLELVKHSGSVFKMGARLRKKTELKLNPEEYLEELEKEIAALPTPPKASAAQEVKLEDMGQFVKDAVATGSEEAKAKNDVFYVEWGIFEGRFLEAYDEFMGYHRQQKDISILGRLGSEYRKLKAFKREPWQKGQQGLLELEKWVGLNKNTSVSFQPCIRTWATVKP